MKAKPALARNLLSHAHAVLAFACIVTAGLLAGCANRPPATASSASTTSIAPADTYWEGRMSLQTQGDHAQGFSAGFELKGTAQRGELKLATPLGTVLGVLRWSPGEAVLQSSSGDTRRFASVDELLQETTGAAVPLQALFDWLNGKNTALDGWQADLSQHAAGRIAARRTDPAPVADLRIVMAR